MKPEYLSLVPRMKKKQEADRSMIASALISDPIAMAHLGVLEKQWFESNQTKEDDDRLIRAFRKIYLRFEEKHLFPERSS